MATTNYKPYFSAFAKAIDKTITDIKKFKQLLDKEHERNSKSTPLSATILQRQRN